MSALTDTLAARTDLDDAQVDHIARLVGEWQLLSDLAFADLLLWVPIALPAMEAGSEPAFLCVAQCRPTTGPTAYQHDQVGVVLRGARVAPLRIAWSEKRIFREVDPDWEGDLPIRREAIPVRHRDEIVAVIGRDANLASVRTPSQLELVYLQSAADLAGMVADGTFPADDTPLEEGAGPRVGDGMMRLEPDGTIIYASPNALSAFNRLGVTGNVLGEPVDALTGTVADDPFDASDLAGAVAEAIDGGTPASIEMDGAGAIILFRALPLRPRGETLGALLLMQDVTELRRRDRQIMSKDATIREIHHRVKNNLQTVAALLRLQARRAPDTAKVALEESMRRVQSIALVHETLSVSVDESVDFDEVVDRLLGMLADVAGAGARVELTREGTFGEQPAEVATALVLVLTELVQNALEHGFPGDDDRGTVRVEAVRVRGTLAVTVHDDGVGLPEGFDGTAVDRLGLQIVTTLASAELNGTIEFRRGESGGTSAVLTMPLARRTRVGG